MPDARRLLMVLALAALAAGPAAAQCGVGLQADAGPDVARCTATTGTTTFMLNGVFSDETATGGPIVQFCWTATRGTFVSTGTPTACSTSPIATLVVENAPGAQATEVTLEVTDLAGCTSTDVALLSTATGPVVLFARPSTETPCFGEDLELVARAVDTFDAGGLVRYEWDLNLSFDSNMNGIADDDVDATVTGVSGNTAVVTVRPRRLGFRTARLRVTGEASDCAGTADITFTAQDVPGVRLVSGPPSACAGVVSDFRAELAFGTTGAEIGWDFDANVDEDGNGDPGDDIQALGADASWAFTTGGTKVVRALAFVEGGCFGFEERSVIVPTPPQAAFTWTGASCGLPALTFQDASTGDGPFIVTWSFGDGTGLLGGSLRTHVFPRTGTFEVTQTITDANGCTTSTTRSVDVESSSLAVAGWRVLDGQPGTGTAGNSDGSADPGERVRLELDVRNEGSTAASGVRATVAVQGVVPGLSVVDAMTDFPVIAPGAFVTSSAPHVELQLDSTVACGSVVPLVVTLVGEASGACVSSQAIRLPVGAPSQELVASDVRVTTTPGVGSDAAVAFGTEHLVAFVDTNLGARRVMVSRHAPNGAVLGMPVPVSVSGRRSDAPRLAWSAEEHAFGIAWIDREGSAQTAVFTRLSPSGVPLAAPVRLDLRGMVGEVDVAAIPGGGGPAWVVAWTDASGEGGRAAQARVLAGDGAPLGGTITLEPSGATGVRVASNGETFAAAVPLASQVALTTWRVSPLGQPAGRNVLAGDAGTGAGLASMGSSYLLVRADGGTVRAARLSGLLVVSDVALGAGTDPDVAPTPTGALAAWSAGDAVVVRAVTAAGQPSGSALVVSNGDAPALEPAVGVDPEGGALVAWTDLRSELFGDAEIFASALRPAASDECDPVTGLVLGDLNGDGSVDVADVVIALRASVGLVPTTAELLARADVAPGTRSGTVHVAVGDGVIDVADVVVLLRATVGEITLTR